MDRNAVRVRCSGAGPRRTGAGVATGKRRLDEAPPRSLPKSKRPEAGEAALWAAAAGLPLPAAFQQGREGFEKILALMHRVRELHARRADLACWRDAIRCGRRRGRPRNRLEGLENRKAGAIAQEELDRARGTRRCRLRTFIASLDSESSTGRAPLLPEIARRKVDEVRRAMQKGRPAAFRRQAPAPLRRTHRQHSANGEGRCRCARGTRRRPRGGVELNPCTRLHGYLQRQPITQKLLKIVRVLGESKGPAGFVPALIVASVRTVALGGHYPEH